MPEGQVSHRNASRLCRALAGRPLVRVEAPEPRLAGQRIPERLEGDSVSAAEAVGKHHLLRFASGIAALYRCPRVRLLEPTDPLPRDLVGTGPDLLGAEVDPWRSVGSLRPEAADLGSTAARLMADDVRGGGAIRTYRPPAAPPWSRERTWVYGRRGKPCRRCGALIRSRGQGDADRTTYWCPGCQL